MTAEAPGSFRQIIVRMFPELETSDFRLITTGWHSTAVDVDDRLIFKFPRDDEALQALRREASLLAVIRPALSMPIPGLQLHDGPPVFSRHEKIPGEHLLSHQYEWLTEAARQTLAGSLARFYCELHRLDAEQMRQAGATAIKPWQSLDAIREKALPMLPPELSRFGEETTAAFEDLPPDPLGATYGFFDGHGWNMAFDHDGGTLNGIYDFADSGFGPRHQDFIYSNFISSDLTARIVTAYEQLSGLTLDRRRIGLLTGLHRLSELAELSDDAKYVPAMIRSVTDWAEDPGCFR